MTERRKQTLQRGWDFNSVQGKRQLLLYDEIKAKDIIEEGTKFDVIVDLQHLNNRGVNLSDCWSDIHSLVSSATERTGYPTQKPIKLLERIIKCSSNEDDIVLDPFAGSGTTLEAAYNLDRKYIGFDISQDAKEVFDARMKKRPADLNRFFE